MGNCQAIDNASLVLQTQTGKAERFYSPISAAEIMNLHPGHYVALLLATTFYSSPPSSSSGHHQPPPNNHPTTAAQNLRVTRIKLLRPTDNLVLGHAYRLITTQEVMKGLKAKKNKNLNDYKNFQLPKSAGKSDTNSNCETRSSQMRKADKHRPRIAPPGNSKPRGWHPSLNSISEATS